MERVKILVVDDDPNINHLLRLYLEKEEYTVDCAYDGVQALEMFDPNQHRLIILDVMLPGLNGWDVCKAVRKKSDVPIIMLTAKGETLDKVLGLELGADDYVVKPFEPQEVIARVRAVIRRSSAKAEDVVSDVLEFEDLRIDKTDYTVCYKDKLMEFPPKEMELLYFLAAHPNKVFTREQLLEQVWGFDYFGDSRTVDVHVKRLREKLVEDENMSWQIKTVWGVGYKFEVR